MFFCASHSATRGPTPFTYLTSVWSSSTCSDDTAPTPYRGLTRMRADFKLAARVTGWSRPFRPAVTYSNNRLQPLRLYRRPEGLLHPLGPRVILCGQTAVSLLHVSGSSTK